MKLLKLNIGAPFRSLQAGFEIDFVKDWNRNALLEKGSKEYAPYVLAGPNGSGKSNVLEVLAAIFFHLECQYIDFRPESFAYEEESNKKGFQDEVAIPDVFQVEYLIDVPDYWRVGLDDWTAHIRVIKQQGNSAKMYWLNHSEFGEEESLPRLQSRELLPDYVLGYSSGENEILSLPFFKMRFIHYDEYKQKLFQELDYGGRPEGRLIYLDSSFSQALLISNYLLQDESLFTDTNREVGIRSLKSFRIVINQLQGFRWLEDFAEDVPFYEEEAADSSIVKITKLSEPNIEKLKLCSTLSFEEDGMLYLDYFVVNATREAFKLHFGTAHDLFSVFQVLLTLNLYSVSDDLKKDLYGSDSAYVRETVPVLPSDKRIMRFKFVEFDKEGLDKPVMLKDLSDGEHQLLHTLGLCLLFNTNNALFLLDEPETHFNPDWRSKLITLLRQSFQGQGRAQVSPEMLITTHTPFLISDSKPENVMVFKKQDRQVTVTRPEYNTLGASINKITLSTFEKIETIGGFAQQRMEDFERQFQLNKYTLSPDEKQRLIDEINHYFGDSVEKMLLIKTILDSKKLDGGSGNGQSSFFLRKIYALFRKFGLLADKKVSTNRNRS